MKTTIADLTTPMLLVRTLSALSLVPARVPPPACAGALRFAPRSRPLVCQAAPELPEHLKILLEELESGDAQLFDVREPGEYAQARLTQALHVPLSELSNGVEPDGVNKGMTTYLHCAAGIRVHPAADILRSMGFERVVPLQEGFAQLAQSGRFPFEIPKE